MKITFLVFLWMINCWGGVMSLEKVSWKSCNSQGLCYVIQADSISKSIFSQNLFADHPTFQLLDNQKHIIKQVKVARGTWYESEKKWLLTDWGSGSSKTYLFFVNKMRLVRSY